MDSRGRLTLRSKKHTFMYILGYVSAFTFTITQTEIGSHGSENFIIPQAPQLVHFKLYS